LFLLVIGSLFFISRPITAQEKITIDFFYSPTCPHCLNEESFLDKLEKENKNLQINRYEASKNQVLLNSYYKKYNVPLFYQGAIPVTFVKNKYFLGFSDDIGQNIKNELFSTEKKELNLVEKIAKKKYSLPLLAVILGTLDGFNICSLGALLIILALAMSFRSRKKIFAFGITYLVTTATIYGFLIFFWYQLFNLITPYIRKMEIVIGFLTLAGGIYFINEFIKSYKHGPKCEIDEGKKISGKFSVKMKKKIAENSKLLPMIISILFFAGIITIVEFPCSAAVPLTFASMLSHAKLSSSFYLIYIALFVIFYLLDEIIIFFTTVFTMRLWLSSPKFVTGIILVQAIIMFLLSFHYFFGLF